MAFCLVVCKSMFYVWVCDTCDSKKIKLSVMRAYAYARGLCILLFLHFQILLSLLVELGRWIYLSYLVCVCFRLFLKTTRRFLKTTRRFVESEPSFFLKTTRCFVECVLSFFENKPSFTREFRVVFHSAN